MDTCSVVWVVVVTQIQVNGVEGGVAYVWLYGGHTDVVVRLKMNYLLKVVMIMVDVI